LLKQIEMEHRRNWHKRQSDYIPILTPQPDLHLIGEIESGT
jgi:hypothetical protein